ncbi:hypothetical protein [Hyphomicrobium sp.]|jgi:hypothetical protein|uniref:hypothetical protein n=1 Tax=Hyphomicrobium sp. TaxID=82 RepID=UPI002C1F4AAF|nr:hypothetical protein [Hyphomicrobium sp.]HVZ05428.1 hypothetical protein [Hyphomicrobium sp.]
MAARLAAILAMLVLGICRAAADPIPPPPDLDCSKGFEALRNWAAWLPGADRTSRDGKDVITLSAPTIWRVEITFTNPGEPGHPAIILRKFLKQVTGVWTAQSKACSFGDKAQFEALLAQIKAEDTRLTNLSRDEVARQKSERSPLAPGP